MKTTRRVTQQASIVDAYAPSVEHRIEGNATCVRGACFATYLASQFFFYLARQIGTLPPGGSTEKFTDAPR